MTGNTRLQLLLYISTRVAGTPGIVVVAATEAVSPVGVGVYKRRRHREQGVLT